MRKLLIILILFVGLVSQAQNVKYYIDPAGSDLTGDGSSGNPWASLGFAATQAFEAGDTIWVNAGEYTQTARVDLAVGVSICGVGVESDITFTYNSGTYGAIYLNSASGSTTDGNQSISNIKMDGSSLTGGRAIRVNYRNNVIIHHVTIVDFANSGIWFFSNVAYRATGNKIYNCTINNSSDNSSGYAGCIRIEKQEGFLCYNNNIDMTIRAAGDPGNSMNCDDNAGLQIYDNTFTRHDHELDDWNFFIEHWDYRGDCQIYDNIFYGTATLDLAGDDNEIQAGYTYGIKVYGNQFLNDENSNYTNSGDTKAKVGITIEGNQSGVYVYQNLIQRYGWGIELATASSIVGGTWEVNWVHEDIYIYYNLITDVGYADYTYSYGILYLNETNDPEFTTSTNNVNIFNNVITAMSGTTYQGIRLSCNGTFNNLSIKNNIIKDFDGYGIYLGEHSTDGLSMTNVAVTYNNMYSNGVNTVGIDGDIVQSNFNTTTGNITTDPAFVGGSPYSYELQEGSGCIDAGTDVDLTEDYAGNTVGATPDIGAYEYEAEEEPAVDYVFAKDKTGNFMKDSSGKLMMIIE